MHGDTEDRHGWLAAVAAAAAAGREAQLCCHQQPLGIYVIFEEPQLR